MRWKRKCQERCSFSQDEWVICSPHGSGVLSHNYILIYHSEDEHICKETRITGLQVYEMVSQSKNEACTSRKKQRFEWYFQVSEKDSANKLGSTRMIYCQLRLSNNSFKFQLDSPSESFMILLNQKRLFINSLAFSGFDSLISLKQT